MTPAAAQSRSRVLAGRSRLVLFERGTDRVLAATAGEAPAVTATPD
jgi:hypothetical protein